MDWNLQSSCARLDRDVNPLTCGWIGSKIGWEMWVGSIIQLMESVCFQKSYQCKFSAHSNMQYHISHYVWRLINLFGCGCWSVYSLKLLQRHASLLFKAITTIDIDGDKSPPIIGNWQFYSVFVNVIIHLLPVNHFLKHRLKNNINLVINLKRFGLFLKKPLGR